MSNENSADQQNLTPSSGGSLSTRSAVLVQRGLVSLVETHTDLCLKLHEDGDFDGAIKEAYAALRIDRHNYLAHCALAVALIEKGQLTEAIAEFSEVVHLCPRWPDLACHTLMDILAICGAPDSALASCRDALERRPDYETLRLHLGECYKTREDAIRTARGFMRTIVELAGSREAVIEVCRKRLLALEE